jgi:MarR family
MSGEGLVELARRFVACSDELENLRSLIKLAVVNGEAGDKPDTPFVQARSKPGGSRRPKAKGSPMSHPNALAAQAEAAIVALLKDRPGLRPSEIARATEAKRNTVTQRLQRLESKGLVAPAQGGGWAASAAPAAP